MTAKELNAQFQEVQKTHLDFIKWAKSVHNVKITSGVCLRHLGKYKTEKPRKISEGFQVAYSCFFNQLKTKSNEK